MVGVDSVNDYYDVALKERRLELLQAEADEAGANYSFVKGNLAERDTLERAFGSGPIDRVIHLAAQAGVRYSLVNPHAYVESNVIAFTNMLEACRHASVPHLTYASTSSVYGANTSMPFSEKNGVDHPLQFYAATKRANELMAHSYSHLFRLPTTGLRFFTVYGPWGRPDMALFLFTKKILAGEPIQLFNNGNHTRDFTFVADIVEGVDQGERRHRRAQPRLGQRPSRPVDQQRAVPHLQHRQQQPGAADRLCRGHRKMPEQEGNPRISAAAAGRCSLDLRGRLLAGGGGRTTSRRHPSRTG